MTDGEYNKMIEAIYSQKTPNFFFLNYSSNIEYVINLIFVPKEFIVPSTIQKETLYLVVQNVMDGLVVI